MKKQHRQSVKDCESNVTIGLVGTIWVDPRVALHARGVVLIVFNFKETDGILTFADVWCIVNGTTRLQQMGMPTKLM